MNLYRTVLFLPLVFFISGVLPITLTVSRAEPRLLAAGSNEPAPVESAASPCPAARSGTEAASPPQEEDIRKMKHRYRHDPTGVRARLGMCRRDHGGPGRGPHHRFRGGCPRQEP